MSSAGHRAFGLDDIDLNDIGPRDLELYLESLNHHDGTGPSQLTATIHDYHS